MTSETEAQLRDGAEALGVLLSADQIRQLLDYAGLLQKWSKVYNLTALRSEREVLTHHLLDSLAVIPSLTSFAAGRALRVADVGSGAGLPGAIVAICLPAWRVDCIDAVAKKVAFVQQAAGSLGLSNLRGVHARVEEVAGPYDLVTSRAFASLGDFVRLTDSCLAEEGVWAAMKGKLPEGEIAELPPGIAVFHVEQLEVPGLDAERCLVWMRRRAA